MYIKFLVLFIASIKLLQVAKSFVIKDEKSVVNVTESAYVVFDSVSTMDNGVSSAIVIDEDEMSSVQSIVEEKNETVYVKDDDKKFNVELAIEKVAMSLLDMKEEVQTLVGDDKDVDDAQSTVENVENEGKKVNRTNSEEGRTSFSDSDEEQIKFHDGKHFQHEEENEGEQEDDENTNKDDHDDDE